MSGICVGCWVFRWGLTLKVEKKRSAVGGDMLDLEEARGGGTTNLEEENKRREKRHH